MYMARLQHIRPARQWRLDVASAHPCLKGNALAASAGLVSRFVAGMTVTTATSPRGYSSTRGTVVQRVS
jgi:hypothetical protein